MTFVQTTSDFASKIILIWSNVLYLKPSIITKSIFSLGIFSHVLQSFFSNLIVDWLIFDILVMFSSNLCTSLKAEQCNLSLNLNLQILSTKIFSFNFKTSSIRKICYQNPFFECVLFYTFPHAYCFIYCIQ